MRPGSPELSRSERGIEPDVESAVEPETLPVADAPCSERIDDYLRAIRELRDEGAECRSVGADAALANAQDYLDLAIACVRRAAKHERVHEALGAGALV